MTLYIPLQMSAIFKLSHFYAQVAVAAILSLISGNDIAIYFQGRSERVCVGLG